MGFASVMQARHLRVRIDRTYVNSGTGTQFYLSGSDNYYWQNGGYISSTTLTAAQYYVWFGHMSRTQVGPLYITPQVATGMRIDGSYGDLVLSGTLFDSTGRTAKGRRCSSLAAKASSATSCGSSTTPSTLRRPAVTRPTRAS